jgi:hypothetical protein
LFVVLAAIMAAPLGAIEPVDAKDAVACPPGGYVIKHGWRTRCAHIKQDPTRPQPRKQSSVAVPGGGATMKKQR